MTDKGKAAIAKIIGGLALMVIGGFGFFYRKAFKGPVRIAVTALSVISLGLGFYLFVDGATTIAIGNVGQYRLSKSDIAEIEQGNVPAPSFTQTITVPGPEFLKKSIALGIANDPSFKGLRRLKYVCEDGSKSFTIFITKAGILGIPDKSVTCDDGTRLIDYDPAKGFVMEVPTPAQK